jgi:hypothetical protein
MRFFLIVIFLLVGGTYFFAEYKGDEIAKKIIEDKATEITKKKVSIDNLDIQYLNEKILFKNLVVKNSDGFPGNLIKIKNLEIVINLKSITTDTVEVESILLNGINFQYKVIVNNGQVIDNLSAINKILKQESAVRKSSNQNNSKKENNQSLQKEEFSKNFIIKKLKITNAYAEVISEDLKINTNTKLSDMEFLNVGNTNNSNHYKDVATMILTNVIYKVKNDVLSQKVQQKLEDKLKDVLNKKLGIPTEDNKDKKNILNDLLKGNKEDLLKKFDKLIK